MDIPDRPLHCSDLKRETIYIKDNNEWTKDSDENPLLINAIKHVSSKNMKQINEWKKNIQNTMILHQNQMINILKSFVNLCRVPQKKSQKRTTKNSKKIVKESVIDKSIIS